MENSILIIQWYLYTKWFFLTFVQLIIFINLSFDHCFRVFFYSVRICSSLNVITNHFSSVLNDWWHTNLNKQEPFRREEQKNPFTLITNDRMVERRWKKRWWLSRQHLPLSFWPVIIINISRNETKTGTEWKSDTINDCLEFFLAVTHNRNSYPNPNPRPTAEIWLMARAMSKTKPFKSIWLTNEMSIRKRNWEFKSRKFAKQMFLTSAYCPTFFWERESCSFSLWFLTKVNLKVKPKYLCESLSSSIWLKMCDCFKLLDNYLS